MVPLSFVKHAHFDYSDLAAILDILNSQVLYFKSEKSES